MIRKALLAAIGALVLAFTATAAVTSDERNEMPKDAIGWICPPYCG